MGKPNKTKERNPQGRPKARLTQSRQGLAHFPTLRPCWPAATQTAFVRALTAGASAAVLQHPWKHLYSSLLANSSFTTVLTEAVLAWLLPSVWEGCLAEGEEHGAGQQ